MSNDAINWAVEQADLAPGVKFVLFALADRGGDYDGEDWTCYPSVERIMKFTNQSRATVERALATLDGLGLISRKRRRRSDGTLGVYTFTLHRVRRDRSKGGPEVSNVVDAHHPAAVTHTAECSMDQPANCSMDHTSFCSTATRQIAGQPYVNLRQQEPKDSNPQKNPHNAGGRARGVAWAAREIWDACPDAARRWSSRRLVIEAVRAEVDAGADAAAILAAFQAYAADRKAWGASGSPQAPHTWLSDGRWENFVPAASPAMGSASGETVSSDPVRLALRKRLVSNHGEDAVKSYFDPCELRADGVLLARTGRQAERLHAWGLSVERAAPAAVGE